MTDWDQLSAMGNLARMNQAKALAQQQAQRDAQLAAQNAEVVRLLKEQKQREEAEKTRIEAMPKCPDCLSPIEKTAQRCPHCTTAIAMWDYVHSTYAWSLVCRLSDAEQILHRRCWSILKDIALFRHEAAKAIQGLEQVQIAQVEEQSKKTLDCLGKIDEAYRDDAVLLLPKAILKRQLASVRECEDLRRLFDKLDSKYPALQVWGDEAAARDREKAKIDRLAAAVTAKWQERLRLSGSLFAYRALREQLRSFAIDIAAASERIAAVKSAMNALVDHLVFGRSVGSDWNVTLGCGPETVRAWADTLPAKPDITFNDDDSYAQTDIVAREARLWIATAGSALSAMKVRAKQPADQSQT